jgi:hypothetical protein
MTPNVRFGSKADISGAKRHVRSTPNSDRKSGLRQLVMSALPPKADMCGALADVRRNEGCPLRANSGHRLSLLGQTFDRIDSELCVLLTIRESFAVSRRSKRSLRFIKILKRYHYDPLRRLTSNR